MHPPLPATRFRLPKVVRQLRGLLTGALVAVSAVSASAQTPLSGTYTINSAQPTAGTNFTSFSAAATRLNADGVSGPVTFNVSGGPYTEQLILNDIVGTSATNRITFNGNRRTIKFASSTSAQRGVVTLSGADYVTLDNLVIDATDAGSPGTYGWGVFLTGQADYNRILNCSIISSTTSTSSNFCGVVASGSATSATTLGNAANFLTLQNDTITGGYYGVILNGASATSLAGAHQIRNNVVRDFYFYGIDLENNDGGQVIGNDVNRATRTTGFSTFYGIYLTGNSRSVAIEKNRIHDPFTNNTASTSAAYGIYITANDAAAGQECDVVNNLIYNFNGSGVEYGMYNSGSDYIRYYHNTVSLDNTSATSTSTTAGFYQTTSATGIDLKNNIFSVTRNPTGSGSKYALYFSTAASTITSNYNDLYIGAGTNYYTGYYSSAQATLNDWKAVNSGAYDQNSVQMNPNFVNLSTGNLRPTAAPLNNTATPLARVTDDFTGAARSTTPDMGAFEFTPPTNDAAVVSINGPTQPFAAGAYPVTVSVTNNGVATLTTLRLTYVLNGGAAQVVNLSGLTIASGQTANLALGTITFTQGLNTLVVTSSLPNGVADPNPGNDSQTLTTRTALTGPYTINSASPTAGTNFVSFSAAAEALNLGGVVGPVTFAVSGGPYTEQLILNEIPGANATRTVRFNGNGRTLQFTSSNNNQRAVVTLDGADYVTIDSLNIDASGGGTPGTYGWGVHLTNNADNNTIRRCVVTTDQSSSSSNFAGIVVSGSATGATTAGASASNLTLENNTITGGYYGVTLVGTSSSSSTTGMVVRNNNIREFYYYGIYSIYTTGTQITGNDISRPTRTTVSLFYAVYLSTNSIAATVANNRIHDSFTAATTSNTEAGVYITSADATAAAPTLVYNNLIYNFTGTSTTYGLYNAGSDNVRYYFNTIVLDNPATSTSTIYGVYQVTLATGIEYKNNNIVVNRGGTGTKYGMYFSTSTSTIVANNNNLYVPNGNVGYATSARATLTDWQAAGYGANSVSVDPIFLSSANLRPNNSLLNNAGTPITGITTDITGATRGPLPDIGAYEFTPGAIDVAPVALINPLASSNCYSPAESITVQVRNNGSAALNFANNPATVTVVVTPPSGTAQTFTATVNTGTLASGTTQNVTLPGTLNMTAAGNYGFVVTATVTGDLNPGNDVLTPAASRTVTAPTAGTVAPSAISLCVSGTTTLTLNGSANGNIQWQQSTNGTTFTNITGATSATYTTPTLTSTTYYRATTTCNTNVVTSNVATVTVNNPQLTGTNSPVAICTGNTATLTATATGGGAVNWYDTATSTTVLATGPSFTTPALMTSRAYYAAAVAGTQASSVGPASNTAVGTAGGAANLTYGLIFSVSSPTVLAGVYVFPGQAGTSNIEYQTSSGTVIQSYTATFTAADVNQKTYVPLNFNLQAGTDFRLMHTSTGSTTTLYRNTSGASYPYTSPGSPVTITGNTFSGFPTYYYYFYDWQVGSECAGSRTAVQVNVTPGPVSTFSYSTTTPYCAGNATATATPTLGTGATAGTFTVTPATGLTINPTTGVVTLATSTAGTYTVTNTVSNPSAPCPVSTTSTTITINPVPAAPTLSGVPQPNGSVVLLSSAGNSQFYLNGTPIAGAVGSLYTATQNGAYTVTVTNAAGCTSPASAPYQVGPLATRSALPGTSLNVYPNPTPNGKFTLELHGYTQAAELTVFDAVGRQVHTRTLKAGTQREALDLSALPAGVYSLRVTTQGGVDVQRLVRE